MLMQLLGDQGPTAGEFDPSALKLFLQGAGARNQNIDIGPYTAYLRRSVPRYLGPGVELQRPLDLARIERGDIPSGAESAMEFRPPGLRHPRGRLREVLELMEQEAQGAGYDSIYVENVLNDFLPAVLERYGYTRAPASPMMEGIPSFYRRLGQVGPGEAFLGRGGRR